MPHKKKLTTYPRTGSRYIPDDVFELLPELIANAEAYPRFAQAAAALRGKKLAKVSVNAAKVTDHHALLPTEKKPTKAELDKLSNEERNIYEMIIGRMLETVSAPCIKDVTTVVLTVSGQEQVPFTAKGYIVRQTGWRGVMNLKEESKEDEENSDLPAMTAGESIELVSADMLSKQTKAPALLTENSLLGLMEVAGKELEDEEQREAMKDIGLGTPATRAGIIENLIIKGYVTRVKKNLIPTEKGSALHQVVKDMKISNAEVTGSWEKKLNDICDGKLPVDTFNNEIINYTQEITKELLNTSINTNDIKIPGQTNCVCPKCKKQRVKFSPKGFVYCPDKECDFVISSTAFGKKIDERNMIKLMTDGKTKTIKGLKSKSGKKFDCALKLSPEFKVVLDVPDQGPSETFSTPCPKCKGENTLQVNDAKLWCSACDFVVWKEKSKHVLTNDELQALCQNGKTAEISDFVSKKGTTYKAFVVLDKDCKAVMELSKRELAPLPYACPKCGHEETLNRSGRKIECPCGFSLWTEINGHPLTDDEINCLLDKKQTRLISGFKKKSGGTFSAYLKLSPACDKVEYVFENKK